MSGVRPSGRAAHELRPVRIQRGFTRHAEGSVLVEFGDTRVLCTASVEERVPPFLKDSGRGWVTAEYGMLPRATNTRSEREAARGKQSGRTQEIQRLVGRSLRAVVDLKALGERQISIDCDVIQADGGTRTASITGAWVALRLATKYMLDEGLITKDPILDQVAAISCGAVFFGALTYIGNGPNFMVKAIAEEHDYPMPSFFGYLAYSAAVLLPVLVLVALVFFPPQL